MDTMEFQEWLHRFYQARGWTQYSPFIRVGFLMEEVGEVARVVRSLEIGRDRPDEMDKSDEKLKMELTEELGDVLGNVIILAKKYGITLDNIFSVHAEKLTTRFE